jgi:AmmeMemoRadiSam system protein B
MSTSSPVVRPAAVAGAFYPAGAEVLRAHIDALLDAVTPVAAPAKAYVVPHAGTVYSGPVAATAYAALRGARPSPSRVVLLGPSHRVAFAGLALPGVEAFDTPLGRVPIDPLASGALAGLPQVRVLPPAHAREHALEVQLPFLQRSLGPFTLVPLVVGDASPEAVAEVLERLWGGDETVVLVSSDLSHFHPLMEARALDARTVARIVALDAGGLDGDEACGCRPIDGLLEVARRKGLVARALDVRTSGDTAGPPGSVVGYASIAFGVPS